MRIIVVLSLVLFALTFTSSASEKCCAMKDAKQVTSCVSADGKCTCDAACTCKDASGVCTCKDGCKCGSSLKCCGAVCKCVDCKKCCGETCTCTTGKCAAKCGSKCKK